MRPTVMLSLFCFGFLVAGTGGRTCEVDGFCAAPEEDEDSALVQAQVRKHNLTNTCDMCKGKDCCCMADCGVIGGAHVSFDKLDGNQVVELADNGYGKSISGNKRAEGQCANFLAKYFLDEPASRINKKKPCCLYTGDDSNKGTKEPSPAYKWAVRDNKCNSLEGSSKIGEITDAEGGNEPCKGCPKIKMCGDVPFPTMFWEVASFSWARMLNRAKNCDKEIFIVVPGVHNLSPADIEKKISFRVEIDAIASDSPPSDLYFVTDASCAVLEGAFCGAPALKLSLTGGSLRNKVFCIGEATSKTLDTIKDDHNKRNYLFTCEAHTPSKGRRGTV